MTEIASDHTALYLLAVVLLFQFVGWVTLLFLIVFVRNTEKAFVELKGKYDHDSASIRNTEKAFADFKGKYDRHVILVAQNNVEIAGDISKLAEYQKQFNAKMEEVKKTLHTLEGQLK